MSDKRSAERARLRRAEVARDSPWLTRDEAAAYAGVSPTVIWSLVNTGALKSYLPLGASEDSPRRVVFKGDVDELIKSRVVKAPFASLVAAGVVDVTAVLPEGARA